MCKNSAEKLAELNNRLTTSSVAELVKWHQELRESIEQISEEEAKEMRILLIKIQGALVSANSSKVYSDNEKYKKLMKYIQDQENHV